MDVDCEDRLLEIQYFAARDWSMDAHLVEACDADARELCHTASKWWEHNPNAKGATEGHIVISCLYRHAYVSLEEDDDTKSDNKKV